MAKRTLIFLFVCGITCLICAVGKQELTAYISDYCMFQLVDACIDIGATLFLLTVAYFTLTVEN